MQYVLLLRGINVGGKMVKMDNLKKMLEGMGFSSVKTLLNSGNVIFESEIVSREQIRLSIEIELEQTFGFIVNVLIRTRSEIDDLVASDPFRNIPITEDTRRYVTFLSEKSHSSLIPPYVSPEKDLRILRITDSEVCSVIIVSTNKNTTDMMSFLEKEFGKKITTRNWNTVLKLVR